MISGYPSSQKNRNDKVAKKILDTLKREYPDSTTSLSHKNPLELLVATILSAQCTDKMVNKVTPLLFKRYTTALDYAKADIRNLERQIRSIGLYKTKSRNIRKMGRALVRDFAGEVPSSMEDLIRLPGVGRKTANIVLSNAFQKDEGIAVDTHVKRLSKRLGLTEEEIPDKIESDLTALLPRSAWGRVNHLLVTHGRTVCRAKDPAHGSCCIRRCCLWYKLNKDSLNEKNRMRNKTGKTE